MISWGNYSSLLRAGYFSSFLFQVPAVANYEFSTPTGASPQNHHPFSGLITHLWLGSLLSPEDASLHLRARMLSIRNLNTLAVGNKLLQCFVLRPNCLELIEPRLFTKPSTGISWILRVSLSCSKISPACMPENH